MTGALPVHLLTGFLGAGKTTLLSRLLRDPALGSAAVLINEFGEVGLDHHLLERIDERTVLLQSGCLCCTIRGELAEAVRDLLSRRDRGIVPPFDRLVIESTGLADPFPILSTLRADPVLAHHVRSAGTWTVVDAVNAPDNLSRHAETRRQVAAADRILVTKTDLVPPEAAARLAARLARMNPAAGIRDARAGGWTAAWLLAEEFWTSGSPTKQVDHTEHGRHHHHHAEEHDPNRHGEAVRAFSMLFEDAIDWTAFGIWLSMLLNRHGAQVLRVKGILNLEGESRPVAVHGVQHLVHPPVHMAAWPDADRRSRLVFIADGLEPAAIRRSFDTLVLKRAAGAPAAKRGAA